LRNRKQQTFTGGNMLGIQPSFYNRRSHKRDQLSKANAALYTRLKQTVAFGSSASIAFSFLRINETNSSPVSVPASHITEILMNIFSSSGVVGCEEEKWRLTDFSFPTTYLYVLQVEHDPHWSMVAGVDFVTHPSVHTAVYEPIRHLR
jgi:hypothetical protein